MKRKLTLRRQTIRHLRSHALHVAGAAMSPGGGGPIDSSPCSGVQTCSCPGTPTCGACTSQKCKMI